MTRAVIAGFARTPFHFANKGKLAGVRPDDLAAIAIKALVERTGIDPEIAGGCRPRHGLSGSRAGLEHRPPRQPAGRPAHRTRRHHDEPLLRLVHVGHPLRRRPDRHRRRRSLHRRRRRKHDARAAGRLQPFAQPALQGQGRERSRRDARSLHLHGRDGRERRAPVRHLARRPGKARLRLADESRRSATRRPPERRDRRR